MYNTEREYFVAGEPRKWGEVRFTAKGIVKYRTLLQSIYTLYRNTRFNKDLTVSILLDRVYYIYLYRGEKYISKVCQDTLYKLVDASYGKKEKPYRYHYRYKKRHNNARWNNAHYIGRVKMYSKLSTVDNYRGKNRDRGKQYFYQNLGWDDSCTTYSTGWKHNKKRHQWE